MGERGGEGGERGGRGRGEGGEREGGGRWRVKAVFFLHILGGVRWRKLNLCIQHPQ